MNKEIIGYKLKEKIEGFKTNVGDICKDAKYYPLYKDHPKFEPVYKEEPKFEVGKWYYWKPKCHSPKYWVVKCSALRNNLVEYNNYLSFTNDVFSTYSDNMIGGAYSENCEDWAGEALLSEILEFLPNNHPDKIAKEFVLPEEWYVKVTEANKEFFTKLRGWVALNGYITSQRLGTKTWGLWLPNPYGKEITLEQFKKYVLKEVDWTKATKEELLAEAKRRYPLLSVIKGLCGETFTLRGYELQYSNHTRILKASDRDAQYLYKDNKWAEIIEQPKKAPYTPGMRTPDIGPYYGKTELFSKEQLEVINKMIDDKVKELQ